MEEMDRNNLIFEETQAYAKAKINDKIMES
jgi:hypothetical protein